MSEQQQEYGGIIINGIDCSGGSGSSVTPNPPAPATETLSSLDINGVVYGIEQETRENIFSIFDTSNKNSRCSDGELTPGESFWFEIDDPDPNTDWSGSMTIYNNNAYDLTDIDKLELVVDIEQQSDYAYLWLTFSDTKYTWGTSSWPGVYQNKTSALQISQSGSYEVDVSSLTGNYYIYIGATSGKDSVAPGDCNNAHNGYIKGTVTEFNIISSSMGTSVTPNPDGSATEVLKKIKIDEDIYKVADVEEVTEEQYSALPSTKNSDDTIYMIKHIEDIFDGGSTISLLGGNGITLESSSVTGKIGTLSAYEYSAGYEGFNIALQNLTVGQTYKLEFDFQFTSAQFIGDNYRCAYLISTTQKTNYTDYTQWTENLPRDLVKHHHSVQFTASATTMYLSFNLSGCSDNVNNYFTMNNFYVINTTAQNKIILNGNQYGVSAGGGGSAVIANPSGTATATLNKVSIDGVIYDIPSGGSGGTTSTLLYKATDHTKKTFELSENWDNYDSLLVTMLADDPTVDATFPATTINVASITDGMIVGLGGNGYTWYKLNPTTDKKTFTYWISNSSYYIDSVVGVKQATGGGGGGFSSTTLYTGTQRETTIDLSDDYTNYDFILVQGFSTASTGYLNSTLISVNDISTNNHIGISDDASYIWYTVTDSDTFTYDFSSGEYYIKAIYGLKESEGGGGGEGYTRDTLYSSQITTPQQVTLSSNIDNYDVLEVVVAGGASLTPYQIDVNYFKEACPYVANPTYENDHWIIHTYQNRYIRIIMGDANNKIYPYDINNQTIEEINGIKYNASGGGGNFYKKTTAEYQALPTADKENPDKLYFIDDSGAVIEDIDPTDWTNNYEHGNMNISVVSDKLTYDWDGGTDIGALSVITTAIPSTVDKIKFKITTGTSYNTVHTPSVDQFKIYIGLRDTNSTAFFNPTQVTWLASTNYNTANSVWENELDLSNVTDSGYLYFYAPGWDLTLDYMQLETASGSTDNCIYYQNIKYADSTNTGNVDDVYVNGESVLDTDKIAQVKTHKERTTAEYYAIPEEIRNTDNVLYAITDDGIHLGDTYAPVIYSTEEREIGVWTDNKPLYQKTIAVGALPNTTTKTVAHNISNIAFIAKVYGTAYSSTNGYTLPLEDTDADAGISGVIRVFANSTNIFISTKRDQSEYDVCFVTLQYTKTTDVAGSGSYNTLGVPTVHYTTDEQVIGTWVDGKPLYRKTVIKSGTISQRETVSLGIANVENIFLVSDASNVNNGQTPLPLVTGTDNSNNTGGFFDIQQSDTSFLFRIGSGMVGYVENAIITVQYTKTTD